MYYKNERGIVDFSEISDFISVFFSHPKDIDFKKYDYVRNKEE